MGTRGFGIVLAFAAALAGASGAWAQAPLPKTIRIVVPFSAGGSNDVVARAIATPLSARLGVPVIVENRAGAAGVVGGGLQGQLGVVHDRRQDVVELVGDAAGQRPDAAQLLGLKQLLP